MDAQEIEPGGMTTRKSYAGRMTELNQALADLERAINELSKQNGAGASEPVALPADGAWASSSEPTWDAPPTVAAGTLVVVSGQGAAWEGQEAELDSDTLRLLTRFLSGAAMWGADELLERLRYWQAEVDSGSYQLPAPKPLADATAGDLTRYFLLGTLAWGRRKLLRVANDAFQMSASASGTLARTADRLTDNWLMRPLRDPVDSALMQLAVGVRLRIQEGWQEEQISRWLAVQTIPDITHDSTDYIIDYVSDNPQLAALVRDQLGQQSLGLASTVVDNGRELSGGADNLVEGVVRKLLRRKPRRELPPSPLAGKPQTMYSLAPPLPPGDPNGKD